MGYTDLENLNLKHSFPAVDLGTKSADCAIQVTVMSSSTKIVETQEKFFEHGIMKRYSKLIFVIFGESSISGPDRERPQTAYSGRLVRNRGAIPA
ncbi:SMEK domain-containing protein [Achromobacter insuavis]|uniref:SMEK domain-containing protein n=1 Tax=Achromobacter insuavis TaxID=1287735 RepID=UPI000A475040|nr:SMEK domain-containing protein [Achromobacter insuavis]